MKLDTAQPGLSAFFFPYQAALLQYLFEKTNPKSGLDGLISQKLWRWHNDYYAERVGTRKVSRATVINSLNDLVDRGILTYVEESCQGGYRRVYSVAMTPEELETHIRTEIRTKLYGVFHKDWWRVP